MTWNTNEKLPRDQAIAKITEMAKDENITGSFKVYYNGNLMANPNDLPETVDMSLVKVSAVLDNA